MLHYSYINTISPFVLRISGTNHWLVLVLTRNFCEAPTVAARAIRQLFSSKSICSIRHPTEIVDGVVPQKASCIYSRVRLDRIGVV